MRQLTELLQQIIQILGHRMIPLLVLAVIQELFGVGVGEVLGSGVQ